MKKLFNMLTLLSLTTTSSTAVVACGEEYDKNEVQELVDAKGYIKAFGNEIENNKIIFDFSDNLIGINSLRLKKETPKDDDKEPETYSICFSGYNKHLTKYKFSEENAEEIMVKDEKNTCGLPQSIDIRGYDLEPGKQPEESWKNVEMNFEDLTAGIEKINLNAVLPGNEKKFIATTLYENFTLLNNFKKNDKLVLEFYREKIWNIFLDKNPDILKVSVTSKEMEQDSYILKIIQSKKSGVYDFNFDVREEYKNIINESKVSIYFDFGEDYSKKDESAPKLANVGEKMFEINLKGPHLSGAQSILEARTEIFRKFKELNSDIKEDEVIFDWDYKKAVAQDSAEIRVLPFVTNSLKYKGSGIILIKYVTK